MKVIIGLGNPGEKYKLTRHNIGFMFLDYFQKGGQSQENDLWTQWSYESKFLAEISEGILCGEKILLVKPQTYMNLSGTSLQKICQFYKLEAADIIVIYDDKDMDFGKVRVREKGSAGGHNGIKDIMRYLGVEWNRIKIGIGKTPKNFETADWVLSRFSEEEEIELQNEVFAKVHEELLKILKYTVLHQNIPLPKTLLRGEGVSRNIM